MKLSDFLQDTLGVSKGSVKIPIGGLIHKYRNQYNTMTQVNKLKCKHEVYHLKLGERTIIHVKVPSESVSNFYYDILLEFIPNTKAKSFEDCDIKIFSNSPSFVYRYAYVFYHLNTNPSGTITDNKSMMIDIFKNKIPKDRLLLPGTERKIGEKPLNEPPIIRNSLGLPLFDKTLYYAIFYILDNLNYQATVHKVIKYYTERQLMLNVLDFDTLMIKRHQAVLKEKDRKRKKIKDIQKTYKQHEDYINKKNLNELKPISPIKRTSSNSTRKIKAISSKGIRKIGR